MYPEGKFTLTYKGRKSCHDTYLGDAAVLVLTITEPPWNNILRFCMLQIAQSPEDRGIDG